MNARTASSGLVWTLRYEAGLYAPMGSSAPRGRKRLPISRKPPKYAVIIAQHARAPMPCRNVSHGEALVDILFPPFQLGNLAIAEAVDQVVHAARNDDLRRRARFAPRHTRDGAQRRLMQVIEVRV